CALRRRQPALSFAIAWFLAGHALESTIFPLELVYEHRNYLPAVGPLLAFAWYAAVLPRTNRQRSFVTGVALVWVALLAFVTHGRAQQWSDPITLAAVEVANHPR